MNKRVIVGISGASGAIYGIRLLQVLSEEPGIETHLVMSHAARRTIALETDVSARDVAGYADAVYHAGDVGAAISSGSFRTHAMIIAPCSIKTAAGVASSYSDNLLLRAADVTLKERRRLILLVRETPLHLGHLRQMTTLAELGAVIMPACPAFYHRPRSLNDVIDQTVNRVLDLADIELDQDLFPRWAGAGVVSRAADPDPINGQDCVKPHPVHSICEKDTRDGTYPPQQDPGNQPRSPVVDEGPR